MIPGAAKTTPRHGWAEAFMPVLRDQTGRIAAYAPHAWPSEEEAMLIARHLSVPERRKESTKETGRQS